MFLFGIWLVEKQMAQKGEEFVQQKTAHRQLHDARNEIQPPKRVLEAGL